MLISFLTGAGNFHVSKGCLWLVLNIFFVIKSNSSDQQPSVDEPSFTCLRLVSALVITGGNN